MGSFPGFVVTRPWHLLLLQQGESNLLALFTSCVCGLEVQKIDTGLEYRGPDG